MPCAGCAAAWASAEHLHKARALDAYSPQCGCEKESLHPDGGTPVDDDELIVRVVTGPDSFDNGEILRNRLTALFSSGVSMIRQGASDAEIRQTVEELTERTAEQRLLIGAVILKAYQVRFLQPERRCFCVFDTPQGGKKRHADIMCPMPNEESNTQNRRWQTDKREALQRLFMEHLHMANTPESLLATIRAAEGL